MTKEEVLAMEPSIDMDKLISKEITKVNPKIIWIATDNDGKSAYMHSIYKDEIEEWIADMKNRFPNCTVAKCKLGFWEQYPRYSEYIEDAWKLRQWVIENIGYILLDTYCDENPEHCLIKGTGFTAEAWAKTVPEAICKAVLIACYTRGIYEPTKAD